jgi:hypothetical protein
MSDLTRLTRLPSLAHTAPMASSFDRSSVSPTVEGWFANADAEGFVRFDGDERVMLDVTGPGVITRLWSAYPNGLIRIYFDGAAAPTLVASMDDLLSGRVAPFTAPFAYVAAGGYNLIYPIPFQRGVKVTTTASRLYYNLDYRLYAAGTDVASFTMATTPVETCHRNAAAATLTGSTPVATGAVPIALYTAATDDLVLTAAPGGSVVTSLTLRPERLTADALRRTRLLVAFDGEQTIDAPLGDAFAFGAGSTPVTSLPVTATAAGELTLRFPMPFAREARFRLVDVGGGPLRAAGSVAVRPSDFDDASLHFHARWTGVSTVRVRQPSDWPLAHITGSGYYVGTVLHVANPDPAWWGEGDEKIFVDGESFPSRFGTGTEDYFSYGFCQTERFSNAYFGQTRANRTNFAGHTWLYRFHVVDAIPFTRSLRFDLEAHHWQLGREDVPVQYDAVYFFYARPGATTEGRALSPADFYTPTLPAGVVQAGNGGSFHC